MRRTCFNCNNNDNCIKLMQLCKSMVFRLRTFDYSLIDNAARYCAQFSPAVPSKKKKAVNTDQRTFLQGETKL